MNEDVTSALRSHWLLVDVSYVIFYRYHALRAWYRRAHPGAPDPSAPDAADDDEGGLAAARALFRDKLLKRFRETLAELGRRHAPDRTLFCLDGCRNWRKEFDDEYKRNRQCTPFLRAMFAECLRELRHGDGEPRLVLEHPELEADDIVHYVARARVAAAASATASDAVHRVTIVASDRDYVPLLRHAGVAIVDLKGKPVRCPTQIPVEHFLHVKILSGDKSDNIPPVFPRCGAATALRLARDPPQLAARLAESAVTRARYERNCLLIDTERALVARADFRAWLAEHYEAAAASSGAAQ